MMWSERYRPRTMQDMVGNEEARSKAAEWFAGWTQGVRPLLMTGPPGIGKTTFAMVAASAYGYDTVSLNASDARSKARINEKLAPVLSNEGLVGRIMIFIDEVDGIHGRSDYGGAEALLRLLKKPPVPIVLAANVSDSERMKSIAKACTHIRFRPISPRLLRLHLRAILKKEGSTAGPGTIIRMISESEGDIRSMLNRAQLMVTGFRVHSERQFPDSDAEMGVDAFFKAKSRQEAASILFSMQIDPREKINAFYSSAITSMLTADQRVRILRAISDADMLHGKILRTQNWRLLRYLNSILASMYRPDLPVRYAKYNLPFPILNRIRFDGRRLREMALVAGKRLHMSSSAAATLIIPYYMRMIRDGKINPPEEFAEIISKEIS